MTPPTPDIAVSEERVNELREWLTSLTSGSDDDIRADLLSILDDYASLRAEVERLWTENKALSSAVRYGWKARAEKAEAELEKMTKAIESWKKDEVIWKETEAQLLAELAQQAPLIEAAMGWDGTIKNSHDLQVAALALREEKK
jgi:hypothetical protein